MSGPRFGVLGDDLTGVNAVLAEAAGLGLRCCVTSAAHPGAPEGVDVWGIDLASRDAGASDTTALARAQIARLQAWGAVHLLVKIDSLWRGDPMALITAAGILSRHLSARLVGRRRRPDDGAALGGARQPGDSLG